MAEKKIYVVMNNMGYGQLFHSKMNRTSPQEGPIQLVDSGLNEFGREYQIFHIEPGVTVKAEYSRAATHMRNVEVTLYSDNEEQRDQAVKTLEAFTGAMMAEGIVCGERT